MQMKVLLALAVVVVAVSARSTPKLTETFEAETRLFLTRSDGTVVTGEGLWAVDQSTGRSLHRQKFTDDRFNVHTLNRYDLGVGYSLPSYTTCHTTDLELPMATTWTWLADAEFLGERNYRGLPVYYWETKVFGVTRGLGVDIATEKPAYFVTHSEHQTLEMVFDRYAEVQAEESLFEIPMLCERPTRPAPELPLAAVNVSAGGNLQAVLNCARQIATCGCPYVYGGNGPCCPGKGGYDCSGMTHQCYAKGGWSIPRTASAQQKIGKACTGGYKAGDLLFNGNPAYHVVMAAGGGTIYECPKPGLNCRHIKDYGFASCRRVA